MELYIHSFMIKGIIGIRQLFTYGKTMANAGKGFAAKVFASQQQLLSKRNSPCYTVHSFCILLSSSLILKKWSWFEIN